MTTISAGVYPPRSHGPSPPADHEATDRRGSTRPVRASRASWGADPDAVAAAISPVRKAAIVLVSLDQSLASQLLSHLDRSAVEAVTWEIARLDRVDPADRAAVLEEFYGLGLRRLCFVFDDLVKMADGDIRSAFHDEDIESWALALAGAGPRRCGPRCWRPSPGRRRAGFAIIWKAWVRSGSRIPRRPSSKSPSSCVGLYDHGRISLPEPSGRDEVLV